MAPFRGPAREPYRGVNLGGWLLLEPGPSEKLFQRFRGHNGQVLSCEWALMKIMREQNAVHDLWRHRETYITRDDFVKIKRCGLNAVRLPIGYWVVLGPLASELSGEEPYVGPGLEYVDRAVAWAEELGLQVLLDLHGCPGGESGDPPSGRSNRSWTKDHWNPALSLRAVQVLAERYKDSTAVTGVGVCNEPSKRIKLKDLCHYYFRAVTVIREAGMTADRVTVTLPAFQRPVAKVAEVWDQISGGYYDNVCFDVHYYHCFGEDWNNMTLAQSLRETETNAEELRNFPTVVSEWSLALGTGAAQGPLSAQQRRAVFGAAQLAAYRRASHGWFFWTWEDAAGAEWDFQRSYAEGSLQEAPVHLPEMPEESDEDPLEDILCPYSGNPHILLGHYVFLRSYRGAILDVEGSVVRARWADRGQWQRLRLCPAVGPAEPRRRRPLRDGEAVRLMTHAGDFLAVRGNELTVSAPNEGDGAATQFLVHVKRAGAALRHRSVVYLQSKDTGRMLDCCGADDKIRARWHDFGEWQGFTVEKDERQSHARHRSAEVNLDPLYGLPPNAEVELSPSSQDSNTNDVQMTPQKRRRSWDNEQQEALHKHTELATPRVKRRRTRSPSEAPSWGQDEELATPVKLPRRLAWASGPAAKQDPAEAVNDASWP